MLNNNVRDLSMLGFNSGRFQDGMINNNISKYLKKNEIFLDSKLISYLFKLCDEDSELISIFTTLSDCIMDSELYFITRSQIQEFGEFARQFLNRYLLKNLLPDILKYIAVVGIVPIMVSETERGDRIPIIPHYETGLISLYISRKRILKFRWWDFVEINTHSVIDPQMISSLITNMKLVVNKKVKILSGFQYDPRPNGRLTSLVFSCTKSMNIVKTLERNLLISDNYSSNPLILFQDTTKPKDIPRDILIGTYADSGDCSLDTLEEALSTGKKYIRDQETLANMNMLYDTSTATSLNLFKKSMNRYIKSNDPNNNAYKNNLSKLIDPNLNKNMISNTTEILSDLERGSAINHYMLANNAIPVPNGLVPVTIPHPETRSDFERLVDRYERKYYKAFGLPADIYHRSSAKVIKADIAGMNETLLRTVIRWKDWIEYVITTAYQLTYMENLVGYIFNDYMQKRQQKQNKHLFINHESLIKESVNSNWFKIQIQLNTRMDTEVLLKLYGLGIVSWTELIQISRSTIRLGPPNHIVPENEKEMTKHTKKRQKHAGMEYDNGWLDLDTKKGFFANPQKQQKNETDDSVHTKTKSKPKTKDIHSNDNIGSYQE